MAKTGCKACDGRGRIDTGWVLEPDSRHCERCDGEGVAEVVEDECPACKGDGVARGERCHCCCGTGRMCPAERRAYLGESEQPGDEVYWAAWESARAEGKSEREADGIASAAWAARELREAAE
jgi:hypothetical protein